MAADSASPEKGPRYEAHSRPSRRGPGQPPARRNPLRGSNIFTSGRPSLSNETTARAQPRLGGSRTWISSRLRAMVPRYAPKVICLLGSMTCAPHGARSAGAIFARFAKSRSARSRRARRARVFVSSTRSRIAGRGGSRSITTTRSPRVCESRPGTRCGHQSAAGDPVASRGDLFKSDKLHFPPGTYETPGPRTSSPCSSRSGRKRTPRAFKSETSVPSVWAFQHSSGDAAHAAFVFVRTTRRGADRHPNIEPKSRDTLRAKERRHTDAG